MTVRQFIKKIIEQEGDILDAEVAIGFANQTINTIDIEDTLDLFEKMEYFPSMYGGGKFVITVFN